MAMISHVPWWVRFPLLPMEYYYWEWFYRAGNHIGKMLKVDTTTLLPRGADLREYALRLILANY